MDVKLKDVTIANYEAIGQFTWIELSCDPENGMANSVYHKVGMLPTHRKDNGDVVFSIEK